FQSDNFVVDELVDGTTTYSFDVNVADSTQSIGALIIGYQAPGTAFVAFAGSNPRVLDTRIAGGKFAANEERIVSLGTLPHAKAAIFNVTITETEGTRGFITAYKADVALPNTSNINWSSANTTLANLAVVPTDTQG